MLSSPGSPDEAVAASHLLGKNPGLKKLDAEVTARQVVARATAGC